MAGLRRELLDPALVRVRVRGTARARNASEEELQDLCRYVQETSPVLDIITRPVPVETTLVVR